MAAREDVETVETMGFCFIGDGVLDIVLVGEGLCFIGECMG
jgi:hypothetical protein